MTFSSIDTSWVEVDLDLHHSVALVVYTIISHKSADEYLLCACRIVPERAGRYVAYHIHTDFYVCYWYSPVYRDFPECVYYRESQVFLVMGIS